MHRLLPLLIVLAMPLQSRADGIMIRPTALAAPVSIPDQRALIAYTNGIERLIIETRFVGTGTNFVWVVPLPARPVIEEASSGIFPTLAFQLRPQIVHQPLSMFPFYLLGLSIIYFLLALRSGTNVTFGDLLACIVATGSIVLIHPLLALAACLFLFWMIYRVRNGYESGATVLLGPAIVGAMAVFLLPALSSAGRRPTGTAAVEQLERRSVGVFDVTTVASQDPAALLDWLRENGFEAPPKTAEAVAEHVKAGWVFVLAKVRRDDPQTSTNAIHPLSFTFPCKEAVYPMRLTGLGNQGRPLAVELYLFGDERAEAKHFNVDHCAQVLFPWDNEGAPTFPKVAIRHPAVRAQVAGTHVVTKLTATLTAEQMREDVYFKWTSFRSERSTLYSSKGAALTTANRSTGWMLVVFLVAAPALAFMNDRRRAMRRVVAVTLALGLAIVAISYAVLPIIPVRTSVLPSIEYRHRVHSVGVATQVLWDKSPPATLAEARAMASTACAAQARRENVMLGGMIHEEDSPGNYVIRESAKGFEFVWFDVNGREARDLNIVSRR